MQMTQKRDPWLYVLVSGAVIGVCLIACLCLEALGLVLPRSEGERTIVPETVRLGQEAPDFELSGLNGQTVRLSHYREWAVLLNFWATWCGYCEAEMPLIAEYAQRYRNQLVVLAVSEGESANMVAEFVATNPYPFVFLLDPSYSLNAPYRLSGYPTTYFIDAAGVTRYQVVGEMSRSEIEAGLRAAGVR